MKKNIFFVFITIAVFVVYLYFTTSNINNFNNYISEMINLSREDLKQDGMNSSQIQIVLSAVERSVRAAFTSSRVINFLLPFLVIGLLSLGWRLSVLEKELKEIKKQLDLNKSNA